MKQNLLWKFLFVVFILTWAILEMNPPTSRDLMSEFQSRAERKDTNFTAIVERAGDLNKETPGRAFANLVTAIGTNEIAKYFPFVNVSDVPEAERNLAVLHRLQRDAAGKIKLGLDLQGGTSFLVQMDTTHLAQADR